MGQHKPPKAWRERWWWVPITVIAGWAAAWGYAIGWTFAEGFLSECWWLILGTGLVVGAAVRLVGQPGLMRFAIVGAVMSVYATVLGSMVACSPHLWRDLMGIIIAAIVGFLVAGLPLKDKATG